MSLSPLSADRATTDDHTGDAPTRRATVQVSPIAANHVVRLPNPDSEHERPLLESAQRARTRSLNYLHKALPAVEWSQLADTSDGATVSVGQADPGLVASLEPARLLDNVASFQELTTHARLRIPRAEGHQDPPPADIFIPAGHPIQIERLAHGPTAALLRSGNTLVLNQIEQFDYATLGFVENISRSWVCTCSINCYMSYGATDGFGAHWDDHDVVILQVEGRKYWEVYEPTALSPLRPHVNAHTSKRVVWSGILESGDTLFIPRGWGHRVESFDLLSIHFTIGMSRQNAINILEHVATEAANWPLFRADVPYNFQTAPRSYGGSLFDEERSFVSLLEPILDVTVQRAVARWRASIPMTPVSSLHETLKVSLADQWNGAALRAPFPGGLMVAEGADTGRIVLAGARRLMDMPLELAATLAKLADGDTHTLESLVATEPARDSGVVAAGVRGLIDAGLVHVTRKLNTSGVA